jgi:hypothetical protein
VVYAEAFDEYRPRIGVQDQGELRVQARIGGTSSADSTRACLDREAYRCLEFLPVGKTHVSLR